MNGIIEDGQRIINFFRQKEEIEKLAIHGESIGGCIAIELASICKCDLLIADRTFGCLSDMIYFNVGIFAYYLFKLSRIPDHKLTGKFLKINCYKIIISDPNDKVINDISSLKAGVAFNFILKTEESLRRYYVTKK